MKSLFPLIAATLIAGVPFTAHADPAQTSAQAAKRADLVKLERAGYNPSQSCPCYPQDLQTAVQQETTNSQLANANPSSGTTLAQAQH